MERWNPPQPLSRRESLIMKRLQRTRKLFSFLRTHRHELFDDAFQEELEAMYRHTGAGEEPVPPALLCMALLLQAYLGTSDAEAVELTILDLRWQMVLGRLGAEEPAFGQGTLQKFRERLIANDMDRRLLERTIELAKKTAEFDYKKLPKSLRIAVDSRPFEGAGRVEDTFNLLGHSARKIAQLAAKLTEVHFEELCCQAGIPLLLSPSIKAGLDINWSDPEQKDAALELLLAQVDSLNAWLEQRHLELETPLQRYIQAIAQVRRQDLEEVGGRDRIRRGVAEDRRISVEEAEMRHGRKSKNKRFNGYKEHIATDLDSGLIRACAVTPANRPEEEATPALQQDLKQQKAEIAELAIDRAYVNSQMVKDVLAHGGEIVAKPWVARNRPDLFLKTDFKINVRDHTITCPAGEVEQFESAQVVEFDPEACGPCRLRDRCTASASGRGRTVHIAEDERLQKRFRKLQATMAGRAKLRARTGVEHRLAHIAARQGPKARYRGTRKNLFDLRRVAAIQNLETIHRSCVASAAKAA
jgi:Transposase DDE domain/Transposase domain (DUF772)